MYRHRAGIFLWRLGAGLYLTCLCFGNRSKIETSRNRDSTGWTSLKMLFGLEMFTHSLERSPACFLLKKFFAPWGRVWLSYFQIYFFSRIWMYVSRISISSWRAQSVCCCSQYCFANFYLFVILSHHTAEFLTSCDWSARPFLFICDHHSPKFGSLILTAL